MRDTPGVSSWLDWLSAAGEDVVNCLLTGSGSSACVCPVVLLLMSLSLRSGGLANLLRDSRVTRGESMGSMAKGEGEARTSGDADDRPGAATGGEEGREWASETEWGK